MEQIHVRTSPKDFFLHLLAIATLYFSAGSFLALVFEYINLYFPDFSQGAYFDPQSSFSSIRWSIASLVIVFPVYILTSWWLNKSYSIDPEKRNLRVRKWLIYFTLFATALIIIGDLVYLVFSLLGGELTVRFVLKVITVFFVTGSIFGYYLWDVRKHRTE